MGSATRPQVGMVQLQRPVRRGLWSKCLSVKVVKLSWWKRLATTTPLVDRRVRIRLSSHNPRVSGSTITTLVPKVCSLLSTVAPPVVVRVQKLTKLSVPMRAGVSRLAPRPISRLTLSALVSSLTSRLMTRPSQEMVSIPSRVSAMLWLAPAVVSRVMDRSPATKTQGQRRVLTTGFRYT